MRDFGTVVQQMLDKIPFDKQILRDRLNSYVDTANYTPPEGMEWLWRCAYGQMVEHVIPKDNSLPTGWQKEVLEIWCGVK